MTDLSDEQLNQMKSDEKNRDLMVKGSIWMTIGNVTSRLLGVIYVIPWMAWMGSQSYVANALYNKGYNIYAIFLMISTAGIPAAIAKKVAYYNSLNEYGISRRLFKRALSVMAVMGIVLSGLMFLLAPVLADGNKDLVPTMRALALAVLIVPFMSAIRGYFQGNNELMPFALSQIIEQIARVIYMLGSVFVIMKVLDGSYVTAVTHSTFAAFIGAVASIGALLLYYRKQRPEMKYLEAHSRNEIEVSENELLKDIFIQAIPFIIVGAGITLFNLIDQFTFERGMSWFTKYSPRQLLELLTIFSGNPSKLTMVTIGLATSISVTGLPLITKAYTVGNIRGLAKLVGENIQLFFFVMLPATFGMVVLATPLQRVFFLRYDLFASSVLKMACFVAILLGLFMIVSVIMQGIDLQQEAVMYLLVGLAVKFAVQMLFIRWFETYGPLLATALGMAVTCWLMLKEIKKATRLNFSLTLRRTALILIVSGLMALVAVIVRQLAYIFLDPESWIQSFVIIIIVAIAGIAFYGYAVLRLRIADRLLGPKVAKLREKLNIQ